MAVVNIKNSTTWMLVAKAPLMPATVFAVIASLATVFMGIHAAVWMPDFLGAVSQAGLLATMFAVGVWTFAVFYLYGLAATPVLCVFVRNLLPDELPNLPLLSKLNGSRGGRIFLFIAFAFGAAILGIGLWLLLFTLMCIFEFSSSYDAALGVKGTVSDKSIGTFY